MVDLLLVFSLGFLGSFGHCFPMCGPLGLAFALPVNPPPDHVPGDRSIAPNPWRFQLLLNGGRVLSYGLGGAAIGWVGSVLLAGGQMAGLGSPLRQGLGLLTGGMLVWFGLGQVSPGLLPPLPLLNPMVQAPWHQRLQRTMGHLAQGSSPLRPLGLGLVWGLMPCGFLYAAQLRAAETGHWLQGAAILLAFGLGTCPTMVGLGLWAGGLGHDRRSQLFRLGGWVTLAMGLLTLVRTAGGLDAWLGHGALALLALALVARPLSSWWPGPLTYRRALGVGGFALGMAHACHWLGHGGQWSWQALGFLVPQHRWGLVAGGVALGLLAPAAVTSYDRAQRILGTHWRRIHGLTVPAFPLAAIHALWLGSPYLGRFQVTGATVAATTLLGLGVAGVFLLRWRGLSSWLRRGWPPGSPQGSGIIKGRGGD